MFTRRVHPQFKTVVGYYNAASSLQAIPQIRVPTLVLHSADDLITPVQCVPVEELLCNPNIITAITPKGSHVCYFTDSLGRERWFPKAAIEFLDSVLTK